MKNLKYYMGLPYTTVLQRDEDGDVVARIQELQGCATHGATEVEALSNLAEAKELWISSSLEDGLAIPEPEPEDLLPSGKWLQRVPRSLHKRLSDTAKKEGVSLNQCVTAILAEAVGHRAGEAGQVPLQMAEARSAVPPSRVAASRAEDRGAAGYKARSKAKRGAQRKHHGEELG